MTTGALARPRAKSPLVPVPPKERAPSLQRGPEEEAAHGEGDASEDAARGHRARLPPSHHARRADFRAGFFGVDMFRYGITPQFVSRFESIVVLNDLAESDLARIFVEPEGSIFRTSRDYFARFGIDLQITRGALVAIAWEASRQKRLGARALRETFRRVIGSLEFDPTAADGAKQTLTIDEERVKGVIRHP